MNDLPYKQTTDPIFEIVLMVFVEHEYFFSSMAGNWQTNIIAAALTYITYRIIFWYISERRFNKFAVENACLEPANRTGPFPYGFPMLWRIK